MAYVEEFSASDTWTCPADVHFVAVECWGGGGAGGGVTAATANAGGGGGAGGAYAFKGMIPVTPTTNYTVTVGATKTGTSEADGGEGNETSFVGDGADTCLAKGGAGGVKDNGAGGVGSTTGCVGDLVYAGGSGGPGDATHGAAGAGAAGSQGVGADGTATTVGAGTAINPQKANNGGNGGTARTTAGNGLAGVVYGGGGAGGLNLATPAARTGGSGAAGYLRILYATNTPSGGGLMRNSSLSGGTV